MWCSNSRRDTLAGNDAGDVFLQLLLPVREDEVLPALDGEDNANVDLRVGVGHGVMPLLAELGWFSLLVSINMALLSELKLAAGARSNEGIEMAVGSFIKVVRSAGVGVRTEYFHNFHCSCRSS